MKRMKTARSLCLATALVCVLSGPAAAQQASLTGIVTDPLGARVSSAVVLLVDDREATVATVTSSTDGTYTFPGVPSGRYRVRTSAPGFEAVTSAPVFVGTSGQAWVDVTLQIGQLEQAVVVTAAAAGVDQARTGAPITVIDARTIDALNKPDLLESLRLVPGAQVLQTGARGGTTSLFIRGGASNFNKVVIDGVVANDIGGGFDFAQVATTGVDRIEVLRQTNSVVYGADALAGVVSITSRRGRTRVPEAEVQAEGGNLGTGLTSASLGGVAGRADYFSSASYFATDNNVPNNAYRNGTYAGRFGVALGHGTDVSGTVRRTGTKFGNPSSYSFFGIADDSSQRNTLTYASITAQSQVTNRLQAVVRFGSTDFTSKTVNPTPTGQSYDPFGFGANYLGDPVTIQGANGYSVTGRAILDYGGTYPQPFDARTTRRAVSGQANLDVTPSVALSAGGRFERESAFDNLDAEEASASRNNGGLFVEGRATLATRHYITAGLGFERNAAFGSAVVPRVSIASYLRNPSVSGLGDTKLVFNAGGGIKAPSVYQQQNSLLALVEGTPAANGVEQVGAERSRSVDIGIEQGVAGGRARVRASYFYNTFDDLLEYLSKSSLPRAGVPVEVANATAFGAYVNSQSYRARGLEVSADAAVNRMLRLMASYTYLHAEVTEAVSASTSFNPLFPGVAIGAFSPLVGARPFRRPANSGTVSVMLTPGRAEVALSGYFAGKRDDSTFLSDQDFGNTLLLPNRDVAAAYQKIDLSAAYRVHPRVHASLSIENLFDRRYQAAFGFPALPFTARAGVRVVLGSVTP